MNYQSSRTWAVTDHRRRPHDVSKWNSEEEIRTKNLQNHQEGTVGTKEICSPWLNLTPQSAIQNPPAKRSKGMLGFCHSIKDDKPDSANGPWRIRVGASCGIFSVGARLTSYSASLSPARRFPGIVHARLFTQSQGLPWNPATSSDRSQPTNAAIADSWVIFR